MEIDICVAASSQVEFQKKHLCGGYSIHLENVSMNALLMNSRIFKSLYSVDRNDKFNDILN